MSDRGESRPDPQAFLANLERMRQDAEQTLQKYEEMRAELGADAVEAYSEDGLIRVKLDADGRVAEIGIDEMAMRYRQTLGRAVLDVLDEAVATHAMKTAAMAQALAGDSLDVMGMVTRDMSEDMRERARRNLESE